MKKSRSHFLLVLLLCAALTLSVMASSAAVWTKVIENGVGLATFSLSVTPEGNESFQESNFLLSTGQTLKNFLHEYTYIVPAGTETVTVSFTSSDPKNGFFVEAEEVSFNDCVDFKNKPETPMTETTVTLNEGEGSTKYILPYLVGNHEGPEDNPTSISNWRITKSRIYQFHFVEASESASIPDTGNLPERVEYKLGDTVATPLEVKVSAPEGSDITYTWYQGATETTTTTVIDGANTATYTPSTENAGVTFYRVEATVKEAEKNPVTLRSATTKFVVKDPNVQFSLQTFMTRDLQLVDGGIYTLKKTLNGQTESYLLYVSGGKLTGTIPDGETIERVWSGSAADELDLKQEGALTVDYDTNTFVIDLTKAQSRESAFLVENMLRTRVYQHLLGRCLYLETSKGIYTIVADSESCTEMHVQYLPEIVELVDADGAALDSFQVQFSANEAPAGSVYQKTLTSSTPAVLRARVVNRGELAGQQIDAYTRYNVWKQTQENWVLVNGRLVGGNFHGRTDVADGTSDAFTLNPGWNVVEVYTNIAPYYLYNNRAMQSSGMRAKALLADSGNIYSFKSVLETSVVYLINYGGNAATSVPQSSQTDTSLQEVQALRFGATYSPIASCPLRKTVDGYELTVPQSFNTNVGGSTSNYEYTHAVLIAATPKVPGATATFSGPDGLVVSESVADGAFLNMEALYGEDKSFTLTVTAANGTATKDYTVHVVYASSVTKPEI